MMEPVSNISPLWANQINADEVLNNNNIYIFPSGEWREIFNEYFP
jgi:hypothetical protein